MSESRQILIANGVNLDLLGQREPEHYGKLSLAKLEQGIKEFATTLTPLFPDLPFSLHFFQSNHEGIFLDYLSHRWNGIIINPGAWTHTSLALADRLKALKVPYIEVHLSNTAARESFRHFSYSAPHASGIIIGLGIDSYCAGLLALLRKLASGSREQISI